MRSVAAPSNLVVMQAHTDPGLYFYLLHVNTSPKFPGALRHVSVQATCISLVFLLIAVTNWLYLHIWKTVSSCSLLLLCHGFVILPTALCHGHRFF